ncbi:uncharacterized protein [Eurosta solidaginis]|uniref:uncharacterized protein n=1 Tax=Eurosta solidaginis TaxID=178769 RepID=UPI003530EB67
MLPKRFFVKIDFELHAVTCPGVWLCTHGYLEVTIKTLGYFFRTGAMEPRFPLLCHDKFTMEGYFKSVGSLCELERVLASEQVEITLWQNGRRMAYFLGKLADVMHSDMPKLTCEHNINVQILMKPTSAFPGIIAPKVELSARVGVKDRLSSTTPSNRDKRKSTRNTDLRELEFDTTHVTNRHGLQQSSAAASCFNYLEEKRRQRSVCHAKTSCGSGFSTVSCAQPCGNASKLLDNESVACKSDGERRLSIGSSINRNSSPNLSQITRMSSPRQHSHYNCSVSTITAPDEHQRQCYICQSYRKVFS